jgi:hypothetical protein
MIDQIGCAEVLCIASLPFLGGVDPTQSPSVPPLFITARIAPADRELIHP